jgi:hypothetical protein
MDQRHQQTSKMIYDAPILIDTSIETPDKLDEFYYLAIKHFARCRSNGETRCTPLREVSASTGPLRKIMITAKERCRRQ